MKRRFIDAPTELRCKADIKLRDGSGAQCGRYAKVKGYCRQHAALICDNCPHLSTFHKRRNDGEGWVVRAECHSPTADMGSTPNERCMCPIYRKPKGSDSAA